MNLQEVKQAVRDALPSKYWMSVWSRTTEAGIEVGVNNKNIEGSRASLLPIDDESRPRFAKFLASEVLKHDVTRSTAESTSPQTLRATQIHYQLNK